MNRPSEDLIKTAIAEMGGFRPAARYLRENGYDISESGIRGMKKRWSDEDFELEEPAPPKAIDVQELIDRRINQFARKRAAYEHDKLIGVRVKMDGPIGLALAGDWHLDDDGTDLAQVLDHVSLINGSVEGLYAGNIGDVFNNWQGRLARLYAEQSTSADESLALVEDILTRVNWMFYINGNHDLWAQGGDVLKGILANTAMIHKSHKVRMRLNLPSGRDLTIHAVHGFPGKSMWSEVYGAAKKAQLDGEHADIYAAGHIHTSGYTHGMRPTSGKIWHAIQVASYKKIDRYAEELHLESKDLYNMPVALIDPYAADPINFIRWEFDPHEGAERLKWMRKRWTSGKTPH